MAVTVVSDLTLIDSADTTTGWSGNSGGQDLEVYVQGGATPASYTWQSGKNAIKIADFTPAAPVDVTAYTYPHLYFWMRDDVITFSEDKTTGTVNPSGLMVTVETDTNNYVTWHMAGANTWRGEWKAFVLDLNNTSEAYATVGTLNLASIAKITWTVDLSNSGTIRIIDNTWQDVLRIGEGLTAYGTAFNFADISASDASLANMYGILQSSNGVNFSQGKIIIGDGTNLTTFSSSGESIIFTDPFTSGLGGGTVGNFHPSLYELSCLSTASDTISITGDVISASGGATFLLDFDDATLTSLIFTGNTVKQANAAYFLASAVNADVSGNVFDTCGIVYPQGSDFNSNTVSNTTVTTTDGSIYITDTTTLTNMADITFNNYTGKYAIHIPATITGSISFDNFQFDGTGTDVYWAGTVGTLEISLSNGSNATTSGSAGGTVTFISNPVTTLITVKDISDGSILVGARVYLIAGATGPLTPGTEIFNTLTDVNGQVSDTRALASDQSVTGRVRLSTTTPFYKTVPITETISNQTGLTLNISMIPDE